MPDLGQQYLTFDQARDELADSDVKGRNPFKDLRVRKAVYHAINVDLIVQKVLRGQGVPTGAFLSTRVDGSLARTRPAACPTTRSRRRRCWQRPATRTAFRSRWTA